MFVILGMCKFHCGETVSRCFDLHFHDDKGCRAYFHMPIAHGIPSLKYLLISSPIFYGTICIANFTSAIHTLMLTLCQVSDEQIFSPFCFTFIQVIISFDMQTFLSLI